VCPGGPTRRRSRGPLLDGLRRGRTKPADCPSRLAQLSVSVVDDALTETRATWGSSATASGDPVRKTLTGRGNVLETVLPARRPSRAPCAEVRSKVASAGTRRSARESSWYRLLGHAILLVAVEFAVSVASVLSVRTCRPRPPSGDVAAAAMWSGRWSRDGAAASASPRSHDGTSRIHRGEVWRWTSVRSAVIGDRRDQPWPSFRSSSRPGGYIHRWRHP